MKTEKVAIQTGREVEDVQLGEQSKQVDESAKVMSESGPDTHSLAHIAEEAEPSLDAGCSDHTYAKGLAEQKLTMAGMYSKAQTTIAGPVDKTALEKRIQMVLELLQRGAE